jgi:hypothetical protein
MPAASGIYKQVAIKKETTYGVLPTATGARLLDRVDASFNLQKQAYESARIRADMQQSDARHGVRTVAGSINDELCPGALSDVIGTLLKRPFAVVSPLTALSITIAAGAGSTWTVTRSAGSWLTSGVRVGQVGRLTAGTFNAANLNKNLFIVGVTALALTVMVANGSALVAEGPIASATFTLPGKYTYIPQTGHVEESYAVEEWFPDVPSSEVYVGWKPAQASIALPPTGMATIGITGEGKDLGRVPATTRYFTSPTGQSVVPVLASVNGVLRVGTAQQLAVTGLTLEIASAYSGEPSVGSNSKYQQFAEGVSVRGSFTAYFEDNVLPSMFYDETITTLDAIFTTDNSAAADFMTFSLNRLKVSSADKADAKGGIVRTYQFTTSINPTAGEREVTTIAVQDSQA